jgi:soluble lytic murein transglycosylase-like protein
VSDSVLEKAKATLLKSKATKRELQDSLLEANINKPFTDGSYSYSKSATKKANVEMIRSIYQRYGSIIDKWVKPLGMVDRGVVAGFIATESAGKEKPVYRGGKWVESNEYEATGLMQITPVSTYESIVGWSKEVSYPMPPQMVTYLRSKASFLLSNPSYASVKARILTLLQTDAEFNIFAGCVSLRWLSERFSNNGVALFNRVMVTYNAGAYTPSQVVSGSRPNTTPIDTVSLVNSTKVPKESRSYLLKMLGVDGFMDLIYKQQLV